MNWNSPAHLAITLSLAVLSTDIGLCLGADEAQKLEIGGKAPDFRLSAVDGKTYSLSDFASARVLVVIFTCNHCPTAQAYEERIMKMTDDYRPRGVSVIAISPNDPGAVRLDELGYTDLGDSFEDMKKRARAQGFNFPYLYDGETQETSRAYGAVATPHCLIFDASRTLRYRGRIDDSEVGDIKSADARKAIEALLAGREIPVQTTKVFGCSVKWRSKRSGVTRALERWAGEEVGLERLDEKGLTELVRHPGKKLRIINFWATWCAPCVAEFPDFVELHRMYRKRDCEIITVSIDEAEQKEKALAFLKKQQASMKNYIFSTKDKYRLINAVDPQWEGPIPYTLVIEPDGGIAARIQGQADFEELKGRVVDHVGRTYAGKPEVLRLLDGESLGDPLYTFLGESGKDSDPDGVFTLESGVLRISGQHRGYLATRESFSNYRLVGEFRWGEKTWDGRNLPRDSGLFFHGSGPDRLFMSAFECQYKEGRTGDLCLVGKGLSAQVDGEIQKRGCVARPGKPVEKPVLGSRAEDDLERPRGQWNTVEIFCRDDRIRILVNGKVAQDVRGAQPREGKIYLQSFNAELFYRRLDLYPLR